MIEIDGSHGEGGGQLVRNAAALSVITGKPATIANVRAKRPKPGLAAQHVAALRAVAALGNADIEGLEPGSRRVVVTPGTLAGGRHRFDVGTAGSVTLVLQACLPAALLAPEPVDIRVIGGTDVRWSPPADYVRHVFLPLLARMGGRVDFEVLRRGYYPRGGGEVRARIAPVAALTALEVEPPGALRRVLGVAHVGNLPEHVPSRMRKAALKRLVGIREVKVEERQIGPEGAIGSGGTIVLWTEHENTGIGASSLAERGKPAERLGTEAADAISADLEAGVSLDVHASDQVLIYAALARGVSRFSTREVSGHAETTMWLLQKFLNVRFEITRDDGRVQFQVVPG